MLVHYLTSSGSMLRKDLGEGSDEGSSTNSHEVPRCCMPASLSVSLVLRVHLFLCLVSARLSGTTLHPSVMSCHPPGRGADGERRCAFNIS